MFYNSTCHYLWVKCRFKTSFGLTGRSEMTFLKTNYTKEFCLADSWSPIPLSQLTDHKEKKTGNKAPYHKFLFCFFFLKKNCRGKWRKPWSWRKHSGITFLLEHSPYLELSLCRIDRTVKYDFCSLIWFARNFSRNAVRRFHQSSASPPMQLYFASWTRRMYNINAYRIDFTDDVFYFQDLNLKEIL